MPDHQINRNNFVSVEHDGAGSAYDVTVWNADGEGYVVEALDEESPAKKVAEKLRETIASWIDQVPRQILVTLHDGSQVGIFIGKDSATVMRRGGPGGSWDAPLDRATDNPHTAGTYHIGEW